MGNTIAIDRVNRRLDNLTEHLEKMSTRVAKIEAKLKKMTDMTNTRHPSSKSSRRRRAEI